MNFDVQLFRAKNVGDSWPQQHMNCNAWMCGAAHVNFDVRLVRAENGGGPRHGGNPTPWHCIRLHVGAPRINWKGVRAATYELQRAADAAPPQTKFI